MDDRTHRTQQNRPLVLSYNICEAKGMKNKIIVSSLIICLIICLVVIFFQCRKLVFIKKDINELFGKNKYVVENVDDKHFTFYAINDDYQGFDILLDYMNGLGYENNPDLQLGALYIFQKSNGEKASCEVTNCRNIIICNICFEQFE